MTTTAASDDSTSNLHGLMTCVSLHDLLLQSGPTNWNQVMNRIASHPHEVCTKRGRMRCPLQLALSRFHDPPAPPEVIRELIDVYPRAVLERDEIGRTLLYYAATHAPTDIVQILLDAFPGAASQPEKYYEKLPIHVARDVTTGRVLLSAYPQGLSTRCYLGQLPLHRACLNRDASPELCRLLVEEGKKQGVGDEAGQGGTFIPDLCGKTPVDYLCEKIANAIDWQDANGNKESSTGSLPITKLWTKFAVIASSVLPPQHCRNESNQLLMVHAAIEMDCGAEFIDATLRMYPNNISERDCLGRSCLAVASSNRSTSPVIIEKILHLSDQHGCPIANFYDGNGKLPLHLVAESGRGYDSAFLKILASNPFALESKDSDGHYPVMAAAIGDNSDVNVIFKMLQETPSVISMY